MGLKDSRPKAQAYLEIQLLDFLYGEWGASEEDKSFFRYVHLLNVGYDIKDFAFYADFLLWDHERNFQPLLEALIADRRYYRLYAPEGLDTKFLSQSQRLVDLLKAANFQKIYLPCESIDDRFLVQLNRRHVKLKHFVQAAHMCEKAGFELRHMEVNAFVLYGLPHERIDDVVKSALFVSETVGSIIPMLFTPVPSTALYQRHFSYFKERGWDTDLHMLNGKLYPFLHLNEGSVSDYVDLQRFMYMLNVQHRSRSFQLLAIRLSHKLFEVTCVMDLKTLSRNINRMNRRHCSGDSEIAIARASDGFYTTGPDLFLRGATHVRTG